MNAPELALARDFFRRGLLIIPLMWLAMFGVSLWIMFWLISQARLDPDGREAIVLHVILTLVMGFGAAVAVFQSHGRLARFFALPITSLRLVACQMGLGMLTVALMYATGAALLNLTGLQWPILGPSLFLATAVACAIAAIWTFEGTPLGQMFACIATSVPLVIWFNRCYGARIMGDWHVMWRNPTASEALSLGTFSLIALGVAVLGVQRVRRGDTLSFDFLVDWWRHYRSSGAPLPAHASPQVAHQWYESRAKFAVAPALLVAAMMLAIIIAWGVGYIPHEEVLGFSLAVPSVLLLVIVPMVYGLVGGNCGRNGQHPMRHWLATRPVTDDFLARAMLRNSALALGGAWIAWLAGIAILAGLQLLTGQIGQPLNHLFPTERISPLVTGLALPIVSWIVTGGMATLIATGRPRLWAGGLTCAFALLIAFILLREFVAEETYAIISRVWLSTVALAYVSATLACFVIAMRRGLVGMTTTILAVVAWALYSLALVWTMRPHVNDPVWLAHSVAFLSLAMLPFAGMPLAVRWNRHR